MKKLQSFPLIFVALLATTPLQAQDYSAAKKVYYTPIDEKIYFAIDMNFVQNDSIRLNQEKGMKKVPNTVAKVDKAAPLYKKNGDYKPGDILRILVASSMDGNAEYSYIKIIGRVSDEIMSRIDKKLHQEADALFGAGKLEPWPDSYTEDKGVRGKLPNEKDVDAEFYILSSIENFTPDIMTEYFQRTGFVSGEIGNLVIFYINDISTTRYAVKEMGNATGSFCRINIHWKERADKKGKKVGGISVMDLTSEDKTVTNTYEKEVDVAGDYYFKEVNGWGAMNSMADELVSINSQYFEAKAIKAIEKAFAEIK